jgi:Domain of unknown function (DUF932)
VVCQNTLNWGLARAHQRYSIRHTDKIRAHVHQARQVLEISINYYEQFKHTGDQLASQRISEAQLRRVLDELYPSGTGDITSDRTRRRASRPSSGSPSCSSTGTRKGTRPDRSGPL